MARPARRRVELGRHGRGRRPERHGLDQADLGAAWPHVDHDHGDVVRCPGLVGQADELAHGLGRVRGRGQDIADRVGRDFRAQPIGAQQIAVTGAQLAQRQIRDRSGRPSRYRASTGARASVASATRWPIV